jgi:hypothetical protein
VLVDVVSDGHDELFKISEEQSAKRPCVSTACHYVLGQITGLRSQELVYWLVEVVAWLDEAGHRS